MKDFFYLVLGLLLFVGSVYLFLDKPAADYYQPSTAEKSTAVLRVGEAYFEVEIADTEEERTKGLSGRESLEGDMGLLFLFDVPGRHGIWMKDMKFSIDIIWLDESYIIIDVKKGASPDTYPEVFYPAEPASFVLEVKAGSFDSARLYVGQKLELAE